MNLDSSRWEKPAWVSWLGLFFASLVVAVGTAWAFQRGANDFNVFYVAWKHVFDGEGSLVYHRSPDRFLYAPGFAWILAPLAALSRDAALAVWCFLKAGSVAYLVRALGQFCLREKFGWGRELTVAQWGLAAWGLVFVTRPYLIDAQYGQVNLLILASCVWALTSHFDPGKSSWKSAVPWFVLAISAFAKIFPGPLLLIPWLVRRGIDRKRLRWEMLGAILGSIFILLIPVATEGVDGTIALYWEWRDALVSRGFPKESHNQSFAALLHHYFSQHTTHIIAHGPKWVKLGTGWLSDQAIGTLSLAWTFGTMGILLGWLFSARKKLPSAWIAVVIGLLIIPSHLVWKPYFVFTMPLAVVGMFSARNVYQKLALVVAFMAINMTGVDFLGHPMAGYVEATSVFLLAHLLLLVVTARLARTR